MKTNDSRATNQPVQNAPDPREQVMQEVGLDERQRERFRRSWELEQAAGKPSDNRNEALDTMRRLMAAKMLKSAPSKAISAIKELIHQANQPPRLHTVGGRGAPGTQLHRG